MAYSMQFPIQDFLSSFIICNSTPGLLKNSRPRNRPRPVIWSPRRERSHLAMHHLVGPLKDVCTCEVPGCIIRPSRLKTHQPLRALHLQTRGERQPAILGRSSGSSAEDCQHCQRLCNRFRSAERPFNHRHSLINSSALT